MYLKTKGGHIFIIIKYNQYFRYCISFYFFFRYFSIYFKDGVWLYPIYKVLDWPQRFIFNVIQVALILGFQYVGLAIQNSKNTKKSKQKVKWFFLNFVIVILNLVLVNKCKFFLPFICFNTRKRVENFLKLWQDGKYQFLLLRLYFIDAVRGRK